MTNRYESFNEMMFEAYCKTVIDNAVLKERMRKARRSQREQSLAVLSDAVFYALSREEPECDPVEETLIFHVRERAISVCHRELGQALLHLLPRDREIVLLYYFEDMKDEEIARVIAVGRATVQRRRNAAIKKLKSLLEVEL